MNDTVKDLPGLGLTTSLEVTPVAHRTGTRRARRGLASIVVGSLGLLTAGAVLLGTASFGQPSDAAAMGAGVATGDVTRADPPSRQKLSALALSAPNQPQIDASTDGQLEAFDTRERTSRNGVRSELSQALIEQQVKERSANLAAETDAITAAATLAKANHREEATTAEVDQVRQNAKKIAAEKKAAEARLAEMARTLGASGVQVSQDQLVGAVTSGGKAADPLRPGTYSINSQFGAVGSWARYHTGLDFVAPTGTPVYAAATGVVGTATGAGWAGTNVVIHHLDGSSTLYAHLSGKEVGNGQLVQAGQLIGYVGNTGRSFGSHLHFEYYPKGTTPGDVYSATNPATWLRNLGVNP